jgi:uroporphyrinogen-III synthase
LSEPVRGVLITRPEPGASETAARVAALGLAPIVSPLLEIRQLQATMPPAEQVQAILITSANAIASLPPSHRGIPLFAVGAATAAQARSAGFTAVSSADGDASALASLVAKACLPASGPLLLASGQKQGMRLASELRSRGFRVIRRAVYAAVGIASLPQSARAALADGSIGTALFFSAETARHGVRLLRAMRLDQAVRTVDAAAIGETTAVALRALPWRRIRVAARPDQDAMLALLQ